MSANQPTAAWSGIGDPLVVVAGHLVSPQDGFGEIGRMPNGGLRRPNRMEVGTGGFFGQTRNIVTRFGATFGPIMEIRLANGTEENPTAVLLGDQLGELSFRGFDGVEFGRAARIHSFAAENFAVGAHGADLILATVATGSIAIINRWNIQAAGHFVAVTDNITDIGSSGANRPRDLFLSRDLTMGGTALIGTTTPATGGPRLDVVGENSFDTPTMVGAQRIDDLADKWFAIAVRHDAITEEPFIMIAGLSSGIANTVMYGGGTAPVAGSVNAATRHEWYTAADNTTIRGTLSASLVGVGAASLFHVLGNLRIGALSGTNVSVGVNDSGGAGFKLLRVPN